MPIVKRILFTPVGVLCSAVAVLGNPPASPGKDAKANPRVRPSAATKDERAQAPKSTDVVTPPKHANEALALPRDIFEIALREVPGGIIADVKDESYAGDVKVHNLVMLDNGKVRDLMIRADGVVLRNAKDYKEDAEIEALPAELRSRALGSYPGALIYGVDRIDLRDATTWVIQLLTNGEQIELTSQADGSLRKSTPTVQ